MFDGGNNVEEDSIWRAHGGATEAGRSLSYVE